MTYLAIAVIVSMLLSLAAQAAKDNGFQLLFSFIFAATALALAFWVLLS